MKPSWLDSRFSLSARQQEVLCQVNPITWLIVCKSRDGCWYRQSAFLFLIFASAVTWYKDGRPLTSAAGVNLLSRGQVLEIDRAQVSDAGHYKCVAINVAGNTELTHNLQVYGECVYVPVSLVTRLLVNSLINALVCFKIAFSSTLYIE